jgi:hypothetical protein
LALLLSPLDEFADERVSLFYVSSWRFSSWLGEKTPVMPELRFNGKAFRRQQTALLGPDIGWQH